MTFPESKTLAIDFDQTLMAQNGNKMGEPLPGVIQAMEELYDRGYGIIIFTVRAKTEQGIEVVEGWLDHYGIDYHQVTAVKPNAAIFIDDRAIRHLNWDDTMNQVNVIMGFVEED